ncbi:41453_t:CDS:2 [Gigaspora margarita]|uniref:41453_t:CDS:1 n=1 Tax=Gigaspora margarita TaxID=4874 RepID=A0ABM8VVM4_GIGMA|nr:41453_t:CDS:2 [Gigaspora margarita]
MEYDDNHDDEYCNSDTNKSEDSTLKGTVVEDIELNNYELDNFRFDNLKLKNIELDSPEAYGIEESEFDSSESESIESSKFGNLELEGIRGLIFRDLELEGIENFKVSSSEVEGSELGGSNFELEKLNSNSYENSSELTIVSDYNNKIINNTTNVIEISDSETAAILNVKRNRDLVKIRIPNIDKLKMNRRSLLCKVLQKKPNHYPDLNIIPLNNILSLREAGARQNLTRPIHNNKRSTSKHPINNFQDGQAHNINKQSSNTFLE